jgi:hypothetical protein
MFRDERPPVAGVVLMIIPLLIITAWYWLPRLDVFMGGGSGQAITGSPPSVEVAAAEAAPLGSPTLAAAPHCAEGVPPSFVLGFASLKGRLGADMGEPVECEHVNPENGDTLQATSTGLAVYEPARGRLRFTDGHRHWALVGEQVTTWTGEEPTTPR